MVFKSVFGTEETKRFVVDAVAVYTAPLAVMTVEEAYGSTEATDAVEVMAPLVPIVVVAVPPIVRKLPEWMLVKRVVPVAFTHESAPEKIVLPLKVLELVKVLAAYVFAIVVEAFA